MFRTTGLKKTFILLGTVLILIPSVVLGQSQKPWIFDILSCMTGWGAGYAIDYNLGMTLAKEDINKAGGINGRPIELAFHDTQSDITQGVALTRQLSQKGNILIIGPLASSEAESIFPVANREECPILAPVPAKAGLTAASRPWTFVPCATTRIMTPSGVKKFFEVTKPKTVMVVIDKSDPSATLQGELSVSTLQSLGINVQVIGITKEDFEFGSVIVRLAAIKPDAIVISTLDRQAAGVIDELTQKNLRKIPLLVTQAGYTPTLVRLGGEMLEGVYIYSEFWLTNPDPKVVSFVERFKKARNGQNPTHIGALAYDALMITKFVYEQAKITGDPGKLKQERVAVRDNLQNLKNFEGLTGTITITSDGEPEKEAFLLTFKGGNLDRVK